MENEKGKDINEQFYLDIPLYSSKELAQESSISDLQECGSDDLNNSSVDSPSSKHSPKTSLLAKRRLQAYSNINRFKKEEKNESSPVGKPVKQSPKKSKKTLYPHDIARAVIRDIEELKRAGYGAPPQSPTLIPMEVVPVVRIKPESNSFSSDVDEDRLLFKKREIKCRNIRKADSERRSPSPKSSSSKRAKEQDQQVKKPHKQYPKNWEEYAELNLNPEKDIYLKSRFFQRPRDKRYDLKKYFNFQAPSPPIEIFRSHSISGDFTFIPFAHLRSTVSKPQVLYSTNHKTTPPGLINKNQLFSFIPEERKKIIEQLYKGSRIQPSTKKITVRKWYPKNWRKFNYSEAKLLESSVGLSFLQSYSDEEDDNENLNVSNTEELEDEQCTPPLRNNLENSLSTTPERTLSSLDNKSNKDESENLDPDNDWKINLADLDENFVEKSDDLEEEYIKTKMELEQLEASLKQSSKDYPSENEELVVPEKKTKKEKDKKKLQKRKKKPKKEVKNKSERKEKKNKEKKKYKSRKNFEITDEDEENKDEVRATKAKKKKKSESSKKKKELSPGEESISSPKENYEEDIMFFTNRFDKANEDLVKKTKNKHVAFINLEELITSQKEDIDIIPKKQDIFMAEEKKEDDVKPVEVKVDLLKKNEEYLRNQEKNKSVSKHDSKEKVQPEKAIVSEKSDLEDSKSENKQDEEEMDENNHEIPVQLYESVDDSVKKVPDWEKIKTKRKRHISDRVQSRKSSKDLSPIAIEIGEDLIDVTNIKKEPFCEEDESFDQQKRLKLTNTSWESDDESVEIQSRDLNTRTSNRADAFSFEIPLNIQHFTRRDIKVDPDSFDIDISADKSNQQEANSEVVEQQKRKPEDSLPVVTKRRRWDSKTSDSNVDSPVIKTDTPDILSLEDSNLNSSVKLEDEYEEFMKAVTGSEKNDLETSLDSSVSIVEETTLTKITPSEEGVGTNSNSSSFVQVVTNIEEVPVETIVIPDIPTIQIPLPPTSEPSRPVPVPSPKLEPQTIIDLNKPLINLSLSANVTQNITISLPTTVTSFTAPVTSGIDISKTSFEISAPISKETLVSVNEVPVTVTAQNFDTEVQKEAFVPVQEESPGKKIVFTGLTLPSKRQLMNNSALNFDDSDSNDNSTFEEQKRKKLEALIEDNKREVQIEEKRKRSELEFDRQQREHWSTPGFKDDRKSTPVRSRRESSPGRRRSSPGKNRRESPGRRRSPPPRKRSPRRRESPKRRSPPRRRTPMRRSVSPRKRPSVSPKRRRSPSPARRDGHRRSISPRDRRSSPRRHGNAKRSSTPKSNRRERTPPRHEDTPQRRRSPRRSKTSPVHEVSSSFGDLKRSVADSTISDDQLPQSTTSEDYNMSAHLQNKLMDRDYDSPKRISLDDRINQVLGYNNVNESSPKPITTITSTGYDYGNVQHNQHHQQQQQYGNYQLNNDPYGVKDQVAPVMMGQQASRNMGQSCFKQVGNVLQIVPSEDLTNIPVPDYSQNVNIQCMPTMPPVPPMYEQKNTPANIDIKPQVVQVGNVLQIVPRELVPIKTVPPPPPVQHTEVKLEPSQIIVDMQRPSTSADKPSAESAMLQKVAERRAEREKRRQEKENRRMEKDKRRKEKEKIKMDKMKIRTENMIKKALELEQEEADGDTDILGEKPIQWPPLLVGHTVLKEAGKSILLKSRSRKHEEKNTGERKLKTVQFADGIRPGEGTSPSAGEELSSPPPPKKKLPKEKRYKKTKFNKKTAKKKVKVKVIKKPVPPPEDSDSEDNLPPPSPPPGSPPPHVFPPRIKVNAINNVPAPYLATILQSGPPPTQLPQPQQFQSNMYRPSLPLIMAPPLPPQVLPSPVVGSVSQALPSRIPTVTSVPSPHHPPLTAHHPPPSPHHPPPSPHHPPPSPHHPPPTHYHPGALPPTSIVNTNHHHHSLGPYGHSRHY
ncbi:LOW QUALITY PROTEIN: titin-like [Sitophilus oryzae]|uniref:LOW QUALITY PROTEIN: titin-like n=1 Tax=Sitophilus oryzae TaxID=7048 RepID=A0A6J2XH63_SITOR|nr:LOW QUALITY PROTEIN: titin-like [Sitophilus oryzae]